MRNYMKANLIKVAYFDEQTALDCVEIKEHGKYTREIENMNEGSVGTEAKASAKTPRLMSMFKLQAEAHASAEAQRIIRSTISNTILTDFISVAQKDSGVNHLQGYKIQLTEETKLSIYTAITDAANGNLPIENTQGMGMGMEISKLGSVLKNLIGYLECYAIKDGKKAAILRFNSTTFRNNYHISDIVNMNLDYYAVEVGKAGTSGLSTLGLDLTRNKSNDVQQEINAKLETSSDERSADELVIYDIILAGVFINDK